MGYVGIELCDICGRRMPERKTGNLVLQERKKDGYGFRTKRNWCCCVWCFRKLDGLITKGDAVKEDVETLVDEYCGKRTKKILKKKGKKKDVVEVLEA